MVMEKLFLSMLCIATEKVVEGSKSMKLFGLQVME